LLFFDALKHTVTTHLLNTSLSVNDDARAQRLDPDAHAPSMGLTSPGPALRAGRNFYRQMLELRGKLPGMIPGVLVPSGTHKSLVAAGMHEDDERDARKKQEFLERWMDEQRQFDALSGIISERIEHNQVVIEQGLDAINIEIEKLHQEGAKDNKVEIAALKEQKAELKAAKKTLKKAENERRAANHTDELQQTHETVQVVSNQVETVLDESSIDVSTPSFEMPDFDDFTGHQGQKPKKDRGPYDPGSVPA